MSARLGGVEVWGRRSTGGEECQVFFFFFWQSEESGRSRRSRRSKCACVGRRVEGEGPGGKGGRQAGRRRASGTDLINDTAGAARTKCSSPAC